MLNPAAMPLIAALLIAATMLDALGPLNETCTLPVNEALAGCELLILSVLAPAVKAGVTLAPVIIVTPAVRSRRIVAKSGIKASVSRYKVPAGILIPPPIGSRR